MSEFTEYNRIEKIEDYCLKNEYQGASRFGVWYLTEETAQLASQFAFKSFHTCYVNSKGEIQLMFLNGKKILPDGV